VDEKYAKLYEAVRTAVNAEEVNVFVPNQQSYNATIYLFGEGFSHVFDMKLSANKITDRKEGNVRIEGETRLKEVKPIVLEELVLEIHENPDIVILVGGSDTQREKQHKGIKAYSKVVAEMIYENQKKAQ